MAGPYLRKLQNHLPLNIFRHIVNLWPPLLGAGIKIDYIAPDFHEIKSSLRMRWFNINYVGVHFGGSIYAMTDPFYMLMLIRILGPNYIVWDKAAYINFIKPGTSIIRATFIFTPEEIIAIRQKADENEKYVFDKEVDVLNEQGEVVASVIKTLYVRKKN
jgi:hypothetical protein